LINDMLTLARAQGGPEVLALSDVGVPEVLQESMATYRPVADRKPLELRLLPLEGDLRAIADREALLTVVNNLVGNAVRYTQAGGQVTISATEEQESILIQVQDNGPGIGEADRERIFERFYRVEKGRDSRVGGIGLGLAIAKNLVCGMHGEISVTSEPGRGSCFLVRLPRLMPTGLELLAGLAHDRKSVGTQPP
jgi:two-component system phosphate regulon sensor histidine kinase PhoR